MSKKDTINFNIYKLKEELNEEWLKIVEKENFFLRLFVNKLEEQRKKELCFKYFEIGYKNGFVDGEKYACDYIIKMHTEKNGTNKF